MSSNPEAGRGRRLPVIVVLLAAPALWLASCHSPVGPSLDKVTLTSIRTQPTVGNPALCCCHVMATAKNDNTVGVHLTVKFAAYDGQRADPISTILHFVENLKAGESRNIEAQGFLVPCASIAQVKTEYEVRGLTSPQ